jgi:hypothetical protein
VEVTLIARKQMELERGFRVYAIVATPFLFNRSRSFAVTLRFRASYIWMERSSVGQTASLPDFPERSHQ